MKTTPDLHLTYSKTGGNQASHLGLFCLYREISSKNEIKIQITLNTPRNENGLIQLIMMGKSTPQIWVNFRVLFSLRVSTEMYLSTPEVRRGRLSLDMAAGVWTGSRTLVWVQGMLCDLRALLVT